MDELLSIGDFSARCGLSAKMLRSYAAAGLLVPAMVDDSSGTMGTTVTAVGMTSDDGAVVVHVGDSRLYRLRQGRLDQLTGDHTVVAALIAAGELSEEAAATHPHRHVLTRAVGVAPDVEIDTGGVPCRPGDRLLLCTDGVVKALAATDIRATLATESQPQEAADALIAGALANGAEDNVSAVVVDIG